MCWRKLFTFLLGISLFNTISCAVELKDKNKLENPPSAVTPKTSFEPNTSVVENSFQVKFQLKGTDSPNQYEVELSWSSTDGNVRVFERGVLKGGVSGQEGAFTDSNLLGGSKVSYVVEHLNLEGQLLGVVSQTIEIPKDLLLEGDISLSAREKFEAHRVFLARNLNLRTFHHDLVIIAKELWSDGGLISNFPTGAVAVREGNGRSGGMVTIFSEKATGSLRVILNGENGGDGRDGVRGPIMQHPGCAGTNGGQGGNSGSLNIKFQEGRQFVVAIEVLVGGAGKAGRRGFVSSQTPPSLAVHLPCHRDAPEGKDGQAGIQGQICLQLAHDSPFVCK